MVLTAAPPAEARKAQQLQPLGESALGIAALNPAADQLTAAKTKPFKGRDGYCDPWNFKKDPDCRAARFRKPATKPVSTPAECEDDLLAAAADGGVLTDEESCTDPQEDEPAKPGDWTWPTPPVKAWARIHSNGRTAIAPKRAPARVKRMIRAANSLTKKPYIWGGGHMRWRDRGYDCSGATSYVLRAGGFLKWPRVSGGLVGWGKNGPGRWVRVYTHGTHVFMVIAGLRFDTSPWGAGGKGPRWRSTVRPTKGFALRHPAGY